MQEKGGKEVASIVEAGLPPLAMVPWIRANQGPYLPYEAAHVCNKRTHARTLTRTRIRKQDTPASRRAPRGVSSLKAMSRLSSRAQRSIRQARRPTADWSCQHTRVSRHFSFRLCGFLSVRQCRLASSKLCIFKRLVRSANPGRGRRFMWEHAHHRELIVAEAQACDAIEVVQLQQHRLQPFVAEWVPTNIK